MAENYNNEHRKRVREEFLKRGFTEDTPPYKVLEMLLFYAIPRVDTKPIAKRLLKNFGSFANIIEAPVEELMKIEGIGENAAIYLKLLLSAVRLYGYDKTVIPQSYNSSDLVGDMLLNKYMGISKEAFAVSSFDNKGVMLGFDILSEGDLSTVSVTVRQVVEAAIKRNAYCVVFSHNHPGGKAIPSAEDIKTTENLCKAMYNLNIKPLDHIILCDDDYVSMAQSSAFKHMFKKE